MKYAPLIPRTAGLLRLLHRRLRAAEPLAAAIARNPALAERTDSTPHDHTLADIIVAIGHLLHALDDLRHNGRPNTAAAPPAPTTTSRR